MFGVYKQMPVMIVICEVYEIPGGVPGATKPLIFHE
jgi:hypothetical protein